MKWLLTAWWPTLLIGQIPAQPNLDRLIYPPLARAARIEGTVRLVVNAGNLQLLSGHPFLVSAAKPNLERWAAKASDTQFFVNYVFRLIPTHTGIVENEELRGDAFGRLFLRLLRRPVVKRVKREVCEADEETSASFTIGVYEDRPEIDVDVRAGAYCIQTVTTDIARAN